MTEDLNFETYLLISPDEFAIYFFDLRNNKNLYKKTLKSLEKTNNIDLRLLNKFLEDNIFKIEKLNNTFIKNVFLIINDKKINNLSIGIKKKNYQEIISKKLLENTLIETKELFKENYFDKEIMHIKINNYLINEDYHSSFKENIKGDFFCLEIEFIYISSDYILEIEKILEKFQIKVTQCLDKNYIESFFKNENIELSQMAFRVQNGWNVNEVKLVPKNNKKLGIFEKFFQLFS